MKNFRVDVYSIDGNGLNADTTLFDDQKEAIGFAQITFTRKTNVYKVKVWDLTKGEVQPNRHNAPGLIYQLV